MACNIESFAYPAWWAGASTVRITYVAGGNSGSVNKTDVEFLPQGISWAPGVLLPWSGVEVLEKLT